MVLKLARAKFEQLVDSLVKNSIKPCDLVLKDAGLSAADINEVLLVGGQTRSPMVYQAVKNYFGKEPNKGVNPDEVVALGAAIQAAVLKGEVKDVLLLDVTPLSLGIETLGGVFTKLIERNTTIPVKKAQVFSTAADNQPAVGIKIFQGEREMAADNKLLGNFELVGIPPAPRGVPQIEVAFDIDANGILHVSARDKGTGKEQSIRITASGGLTDADIDKMVRDAGSHAEEDREKKQLIEAKNEADALIYTVEKTLHEHGGNISESEKMEVESALENCNRLKNSSTDPDEIRSAVSALSAASHKIAEHMYKQAASDQESPHGNGHGCGGGQTCAHDDAVDAEFEEETAGKGA
jgi:molecular chaperone DnaK